MDSHCERFYFLPCLLDFSGVWPSDGVDQWTVHRRRTPFHVGNYAGQARQPPSVSACWDVLSHRQSGSSVLANV